MHVWHCYALTYTCVHTMYMYIHVQCILHTQASYTCKETLADTQSSDSCKGEAGTRGAAQGEGAAGEPERGGELRGKDPAAETEDQREDIQRGSLQDSLTLSLSLSISLSLFLSLSLSFSVLVCGRAVREERQRNTTRIWRKKSRERKKW